MLQLRVDSLALSFFLPVLYVTFLLSTTATFAQERPRLPRMNYNADEIKALVSEAIAKNETEMQRLRSLPAEQRTFTTVIVAFDQALTELEDAIMGAIRLSDVHAEASVREAAGQAMVDISVYEQKVYSDPELGRMIRALAAEVSKLGVLEQRLFDKLCEIFDSSGATLPDEARGEFLALQKTETEKAEEFGNNTRDDKTTIELTAEQLRGAPEELLAKFAKTENGAYLVPATEDVFPVFMRRVHSAESRRAFSKANQNVAFPENVELLEEVLALRHRQTQLMGRYLRPKHIGNDRPLYTADLQLQYLLAKKRQNVAVFLEDLRSGLMPAVEQERAKLRRFKFEAAKKDPTVLTAEELAVFDSENPDSVEFKPWDSFYYRYLWQQDEVASSGLKADLNTQSDYFTMDSIVTGTLALHALLFGVSFAELPIDKYPHLSWDTTGEMKLKLIEVRDTDEAKTLLGYIYLDLYPRENKNKHFHNAPMTYGTLDRHGKRRIPSSMIVGNFNSPSNHEDAVTFFHEFGHAVHWALNRTPYQHIVGVPRDFVEAPSQMQENWAWTETGIKYLAAKPLPSDLVKALVMTRRLQKSPSTWLGQVFLATMSLSYHSVDPDSEEFDSTEMWRSTYKRIIGYETIPDVHPQASFGHLMGYGAGYYGYTWALAFAQDMFSRFEGNGPDGKPNLLNPTIGRQYREHILEVGGMVDPEIAVNNFLNAGNAKGAPMRTFSKQPFLEFIGVAKK